MSGKDRVRENNLLFAFFFLGVLRVLCARILVAAPPRCALCANLNAARFRICLLREDDVPLAGNLNTRSWVAFA